MMRSMKPSRVMPLLLLIAACGSTAPVTPAASPAAAAACPAIDGVAELVAPGAMLVLGEIHGTAEVPRFVGDVACHAARSGPTTLALEIPRDEQPRIDRFLASPGAAADRAALLAGGFWTRPDQDGRSSQAMLELIDHVRAARAGGADLMIAAYDIADGTPPASRDRAMAEAIAAARKAAPDRTFVVLSGNYHSRKTIGAPWDPAMVFMAHHLEELGVAFTTLDLQRDGGGAWVCMADDAGKIECGASQAPAKPRDRTWYIELGDADGHDGRYVTGPTQPSPPAIRRQ